MSDDKEKLRLLWVVPKMPIPVHDGATHASSILLKELTRIGVQIDLLVFSEKMAPAANEACLSELGLTSLLIVPKRTPPRNYLLRALLSFLRSVKEPALPITMFPYKNERITRIFEALFEGKLKRLKELGVEGNFQNLPPMWDGVVYDGLHGASHLFDGKRMTPFGSFPAIFYRAHNVEGDIWRGKARETTNGLFARLIAGQAQLVKEFELALLRKVSGALTVSAEDGERFQEMLPRIHQEIIPIGYEFPSEPQNREPKPGRFLFVGRLDWEPNKQGLIWLLQEVWPEVLERKPESEFVIIGRGVSRYLRRFERLSGVRVLGEVEDLSGEYARAQAALVPVHFGSGTRVKILEAAQFGCPVISTPLGAQGLGLLTDVSFLEATTVADWISRLTGEDVENCSRIGLEALRELRERCEPSTAAEKCHHFIRKELGLA